MEGKRKEQKRGEMGREGEGYKTENMNRVR